MNLLDELRMAGVEVKESSSNADEIRLCCPFCVEMGESPDYKFRLGINLDSGLGHCFNCSWSSRKAVLELVRKLGLSDGVITEVGSIPFTRETRERPEKVELPEGYVSLLEVEDEFLYEPAWKYVTEKRGITRRQIEEKEIGATLEGKHAYRIVFPVRGEKGELFGFVARDWTGSAGMKFLNMAGTKGLFNARPDLYSQRMVILSEGIVKALAIERATRYKICSAAALGNSITDYKVNQLRSFREVVLFPDPDRAGMSGFLGIAANIAPILSYVSMAWPWPKKQADDMTEKEIRESLRNRKKYSMLLEWRIKLEMRKR